MKITEIKRRITASKKCRRMLPALLLYFVILIFMNNNAWLYEMPVVKITEIKEETLSGDGEDAKEARYRQTMSGVLLNGDDKGKKIGLKNEYTYSGVLDQEYHKGDQVFVSTGGKASSGTIKGLKRDTCLVALLGALILLLVFVSEKSGVLTVATFFINLFTFAFGFFEFLKGGDIFRICNILAIVLTIVTLLLLHGVHRKTGAAVISVFCVLSMIMWIFDIVTASTPELDFSSMEYLGSLDNPAELFRAEIMLSGLGAIMDVAVTISTAMEEIVEKNPAVTFRQLFRSGREIGYDIMGTMMNVLFFVFVCGLIPSFLIRMNNDVSFFTIVRLHIPFEICRFLVESIGIVLAIPVSILIASICMKITVRRKNDKNSSFNIIRIDSGDRR